MAGWRFVVGKVRAYLVGGRSYSSMVTSDMPAEHPAGFDFDYSYWFDCACGRRVRVSATAYDQQCRGETAYPKCDCDRTVDIAETQPAVRDLNDIDTDGARVDQHVWYHSSTYQDWPSPMYRDDIAEQLKRSPLRADQHQEMIKAYTLLALHLGTYAAAIDNMLRRMHDEDSTTLQYWLHEVQIHLHPDDLATGIHNELSGQFGGVPIAALTALGAKAARYINSQEAPGSISLAIDPAVIVRVRSISLSTTALPATVEGEDAVARANADLVAAQQLQPDTTGIPEDQLFSSPVDIMRARYAGRVVSGEAVRRSDAIQAQTWDYRDRVL